MIESQNPDIDIAALHRQVEQILAERGVVQPELPAPVTIDRAASLTKLDNLEALIGDAYLNVQGPQQWPQRMERFPFSLAKGSRAFVLRLYRFLLKKQTVVNLAFVQALQEVIRLLRSGLHGEQELLDHVETLQGQLQQAEQRQALAAEQAAEATSQRQQLEQRLQLLETRLPTLESQLELQSRKTRYLIDPAEALPEFLSAGEPDYLKKAIALSQNLDQASLSKNDSEQFYHVFENLFYNSIAVKTKQQHYVQYVDTSLNASYPFLDAGCGRGEFLENLTANQLQGKGIDLNGLEISALKQRGFQVEQAELLDYLERHPGQYSGISALQVIEHLEFDVLKAFLRIAYQRIVPGGVIILETINPHSLYALSNFYQDPTHLSPLPPEMIAFLVEWYGFHSVQILYSSLLPESLRLFDNRRMNYQDYAIIARR